ncbi:MAG TPA: cysteine methyltransferase [Clostridiales bacterium]|nr:cysteine methyltransferase [Clostridiales bacterium]
MSFFEKVYEIVKTVPEGKVISYGKVALLSGNPKAARQVGWALHANPYPGVVPCHRVVNRFGELSPAFAFGGENVQKKLLEKEGVIFDEKGRVKPCFFI